MPPLIEMLSTASATPGTAVVIHGDRFDNRKENSRVNLRLRDVPGAQVAAAPIDKWNPKRIEARVPALAALGSGGIADLWVQTPDGESAKLPFTVGEPDPPTLTAVDPPEGVPGDELELTGTGFGLRPYGDAAVRMDAPGGLNAPVLEWTKTRIRVTLPAVAPGERRIGVHTLWGDSAEHPLTVATRPEVIDVSTPVRPDEPLTFLPGDELTITGSGFGAQDAQSSVTIEGDGAPAALTVVGWRPDRIAVRVPIDAGLGAPGDKELVVTTRWASTEPFIVELEAPLALSPDPLALLPLRLETRFTEDRSELLVRAIPDAIHVDDHQESLSTDERALGQAYLAAATGDAREDAWRRLVARTGRQRALWVVEAAAQPEPPAGDPADAWTRAARSRLLPRRLYAFAYAPGGGAPAAEACSRPIPLELALGPDPATGGEDLDEGIRWMVDFDEAEAKGMGLRIALPPELRDRVGRVVVVGAETSLDASSAATELAAALRSQRFSGGLAFVPEGTPTNSTAPSAVGVDAPDEGAPPLDSGQPAPGGSNGWFAIRAFGFPRPRWDVFDGVPEARSGATRRSARRAMNAALWPHVRYFLEHMMAPAVPDDAAANGRDHFIDWVRACGPLPVMRVGDQPYGLLPVTPLGRYDAGEDHPLTKLAAFLHDKLRPIWLESTANVPRVSDSPADARPGEHPLLTALSLQPHPLSYRVRSVLGKAFAGAAWRFMRGDLPDAPTLDPAWWQQHDEVAEQALEDAGLDWSPKLADAVFATNYVPVPSPTVQAEGDRTLPPAPNYLELLGRYGWHAIRDETYPPDPNQPRDPDAPPGSRAPLLYLMLRHSLLLACAFAAGGSAAGAPWRGGEPEFHDIDQPLDDPDAQREEMVWDRVEARVPDALGAATDPEIAAVRTAIAELSTLDVETLERMTAEALSLAGTRLDAWQTSLAMRRLSETRSVDPERGVHLCAYGFVEDLAPTQPRTSAGYVHAPSPVHASAAAILASGYRSHQGNRNGANGNGSARQPFGIDLSSERVRTALGLFDGVRAGQPLGALLGYRFERGLQERGVARFIDDFRVLAPLPLAGADQPTGAVTGVAAQNVVDGLELHRLWTAAGRETPGDWPGAGNPQVEAEIRALDDTLDAISDILVNEAVFQTVRGNAARARASLEAAARPTGPPPELEAIYTPYQGTGVIHRLVALLPGDWARAEDWYPREHGDPVSLGERAGAEPRLDAWAGRLFGDPKRVRYRIEYRAPDSDEVIAADESRLDKLKPRIGPLDVVYAAVANERGQLSEIEQRIAYQALRSRPAGVPPDARVAIVDSAADDDHPKKIGLRELMELAQSLRETVAEAPAIEPADLAVPEADIDPAVDTGELTSRAAAAEIALRAAAAALGAAIDADSTAEALRAVLLGTSELGVPGAIPLAATGDTPEVRAELRAQALVAHDILLRRIGELPAPLASDPAPDAAALREHAEARIRAVFGRGFRVMPLIGTPAAADPLRIDPAFADSDARQDDDPFAVTTWFQRVSRVRDGARRLSDTLLYASMLGDSEDLRLHVDQLPSVPGQRWIGLPFGDGDPPPARVSVVAHLPAGPLAPGAQVAGLKLEELTEVLPARAKTTGLAFHYDQPNAAAPQAILIGVPPVPGEDWTLELMRETVEQALDTAKIRMVDLPSLDRAGHFLPALYLGLNLQGVTVATDFQEGTGVALA